MFQIKMMKTILFTILFFGQLTLAQVEGHKCGSVAAPIDISLLETGTKTIINDDTQQRIQTFTITFQYDPPDWGYDVSATLLYMEDYFDPFQVDFSVRTAHKEEKAFLLIFVMSENAFWALAHTHHLVTSREDIRTGQLVVSNLDVLLTPTGSGQFQVTHEVSSSRPWKDSVLVKIFAFVSGMKTKDGLLTLEPILNQNTLVGTTLKLFYTITEKDQAVENLHISYFILNDQSPVNVFKISDVAQYTIGTVERGAQQEAIAGISSIQASDVAVYFSEVRKILGILQQGEQVKPVKVVDNLVNVFQRGYFTSGIKMNIFSELPLRLNFPEDQKEEQETKCLFVNECEKNSGQIIITDDEKKNCLVCDQNKEINSETQSCVCKKQFIEGENGQCLSGKEVCGDDAFLFQKQCVRVISNVLCDENQYYSVEENSCKCKNNSPFVDEKCKIECQQPFIYSSIFSKCVCPPDFVQDDGECFKCEENRQWNTQTKKCECAPPFYQKADGDCLFCPGNTEFNKEQQKCVCLPGYIQRGSICRRQIIRG